MRNHAPSTKETKASCILYVLRCIPLTSIECLSSPCLWQRSSLLFCPLPARMHRRVVCKAGRGGAIGLPMHAYCGVSCHEELWIPLTDKVKLRSDRKVSVKSVDIMRPRSIKQRKNSRVSYHNTLFQEPFFISLFLLLFNHRWSIRLSFSILLSRFSIT
jgi:hypothetical protein